ncbi:MAG TPA: sigma-70 family RNA polymerase sigma factor [Pseudomonadales bacterium]|nr:sigma-70 family RNA polymerase sigma factor [Pseudomonadales bacterium]
MNQMEDDSHPTRPSLLNKLKDTADHQSWREFNDLYGKLIFGFALKAGLTEDEAKEVVQETLIAAANNLPGFRYQPKVCSFKTWLLNLSRWRVTDQLRKRQAPSAPRQDSRMREGDGTRTDTIERVADPAGSQLEAIWDEEWEASLQGIVLARVKAQTDPKQWQIFDFYGLKKWPVHDVAQALNVSVGQIYLVKHRVAARVKKEIKKEIKRLEK